MLLSVALLPDWECGFTCVSTSGLPGLLGMPKVLSDCSSNTPIFTKRPQSERNRIDCSATNIPRSGKQTSTLWPLLFSLRLWRMSTFPTPTRRTMPCPWIQMEE